MTQKKLLYYDFEDFRLDIVNGQLLKDKKPIILTQKSFEVLQYLIKHRGRLLKKKELLDSVWSEAFVEESTLTQHIYMLRKAFKDNSRSELPIETVPKNGYRFIGQVKEVFEHEIEKISPDNFVVADFFEHSTPEIPRIPVPNLENHRHFIETKTFARQKNFIFSAFLISIIFSSGIFFYFSKKTEGKDNTPSLVVLPFRQISGETEEKLGLGMADNLIFRLGKFGNIQVTPTSSIIRYDGNSDLELFEVGEKLQANAILWGTVQRDHDSVRVTFQLYCVKNKRLFLSETIDGEYSNIFSMQDNISEKVFRFISAKMNEGQKELAIN